MNSSDPVIVKLPSFSTGISKTKLTRHLWVPLAAFALWKIAVPVGKELQGSFVAKEFREKGVWGTYHHHFLRFFGQVEELAHLDHENGILTQKVGHLEKAVAVEQARQVERELASLTEYVEEKLHDEAGSELAVAVKTIEYEIPKNLSYAQLQALALAQFEKQEYEKSAMVLHHLLNLKEEARFRTPENFLLSGISWFHLKNFHLAHQEIREAAGLAPVESPAHRSALLWSALVQKSLGKQELSQSTLLRFLELYPHSEEAALVNGAKRSVREARHPASAHPVESPAEETHSEGHSHE